MTRSDNRVYTGDMEQMTCGWLIQVASNNPEPDFPEDLYTLVECGAVLGPWPPDGLVCEAGHVFGNLHIQWAEADR